MPAADHIDETKSRDPSLASLPAVEVRRARPQDAAAIVSGIAQVCDEEIYFETDTFVPDRHWEAALYHPETVPRHLMAVAGWQDSIVGSVRLFSGLVGSKDRHVADLGIFVLKPYRDRGIGTRLMDHALGWAIDHGVEKITLNVFANNLRAIHLYQKFSFHVEGLRKRQYRILGEYVDELFMAKFL